MLSNFTEGRKKKHVLFNRLRSFSVGKPGLNLDGFNSVDLRMSNRRSERASGGLKRERGLTRLSDPGSPSSAEGWSLRGPCG